jgi:hypothetical protein
VRLSLNQLVEVKFNIYCILYYSHECLSSFLSNNLTFSVVHFSSNQGNYFDLYCSYFRILSSCYNTKSISSNALIIQYFLNSSTSNLILSSFSRIKTCSSKFNSNSTYRSFSTSVANSANKAEGKTMSNTLFLNALLKKIPANEGATTTLILKSFNTYTVYSRLLLYPKFLLMIKRNFADELGGLFNTKSSFSFPSIL